MRVINMAQKYIPLSGDLRGLFNPLRSKACDCSE